MVWPKGLPYFGSLNGQEAPGNIKAETHPIYNKERETTSSKKKSQLQIFKRAVQKSSKNSVNI